MNMVNVFDQLANVAIMVRRCPSTTLRRAYIKAYRDWCSQTRWLKVAITGATEIGVPMYTLGTDPYVEILAIYAMSGTNNSVTPPQSFPISPSDSGTWNPNVGTDQPLLYAYIPEAQFALYQTPNQVYGLTVTAIVQPKNDAAQVPAEPLKKYSTPIEAGAMSILMSIPKQPWTDLIQAAKYGKIYDEGVASGTAEVQRQYNSGAQRVQGRRFVMGR